MLKLVSHSPRLNARLDKVKSFLRDRDLDVFIIFKPENLTYLTGFRGTTGALIVLPDKAILVVDPRYGEKAEREAANVDILIGRSILSQIADFFSDMKTGRIGFESSGLTYADYEEYLSELGKGKNRPELIPERGVVETQRAVKDNGEVADLRQAAILADDCLDYLAGTIKPGLSERDIATKALCFLRDHGSAGESFETIVASGENSSMPHASLTDRAIRKGDLIIIDLGAVSNGYRSDITRPFVAGKPDSRQKEM
ncbi:MAG: Xaa-Pro peptidase family protein, partial [Actinomycetota bacterium]